MMTKGHGRGAVIHPRSHDSKLSPVVDGEFSGNRHRPKAMPPYCMSTYVSIEQTCPDDCAFKGDGCYASEGFTGHSVRLMDQRSRGMTGDQVIAEECRLVDKAFIQRGGIPDNGAGGKLDWRFHVSGDISSEAGARMLGASAARFKLRGGGSVWGYTARWVDVPRQAWGKAISVLASVQGSVEAARHAQALGYAPAIVVDRFASAKAHTILDGLTRHRIKVIPCPAQTMGTTCVQCRLCLDRDLLSMNVAIGFEVHGTGKNKARAKVQLPLFQGDRA